MIITHPTDFAQFRKMIADMTIPELNEMSALIERDIVKHIDSWSHKGDIQEWSMKIKLIAEEHNSRRILKLEYDAA
jgi:hypothetical protein